MQVKCRVYRSYIELWWILAGYGFQAKRFRQMQYYALTSCLIETLCCENTTLIRGRCSSFYFFFNSLPSYTSTTHVRLIPRYARFGRRLNGTTEKRKKKKMISPPEHSVENLKRAARVFIKSWNKPKRLLL